MVIINEQTGNPESLKRVDLPPNLSLDLPGWIFLNCRVQRTVRYQRYKSSPSGGLYAPPLLTFLFSEKWGHPLQYYQRWVQPPALCAPFFFSPQWWTVTQVHHLKHCIHFTSWGGRGLLSALRWLCVVGAVYGQAVTPGVALSRESLSKCLHVWWLESIAMPQEGKILALVQLNSIAHCENVSTVAFW